MIKLSARQTGIIIYISIITLKIITFPSLYAEYAGVDAYLSIIITLFIDVCMLAIIMYVAKRNPDKNFEQIFREKFGTMFVKFFSFTLALYFIVKSIFLIMETQNYLVETLFTNLEWHIFLIPLLLLMAFIMSKSLHALGRSAEVLFYAIVVVLLITLVIPIQFMDLSNLLPFMDNGFKSVMKGGFYGSFSTGDYVVFLMLMGKFKQEKNANKTIARYAIAGVLTVTAFYVVMFSVFGSLGVNQTLAISDLPLYVSFPTRVGRLDWITINLWTVCLIFQTGVALTFGLYAFSKTFTIKSKGVGIGIIMSLITVITYLLYLNLPLAVEIVAHPVFCTFHLTYITAIPILAITTQVKFKKRRRYEKTKKIMAE